MSTLLIEERPRTCFIMREIVCPCFLRFSRRPIKTISLNKNAVASTDSPTAPPVSVKCDGHTILWQPAIWIDNEHALLERVLHFLKHFLHLYATQSHRWIVCLHQRITCICNILDEHRCCHIPVTRWVRSYVSLVSVHTRFFKLLDEIVEHEQIRGQRWTGIIRNEDRDNFRHCSRPRARAKYLFHFLDFWPDVSAIQGDRYALIQALSTFSAWEQI